MRCFGDFLNELESLKSSTHRSHQPRQRYATGGSVSNRMKKLAAEGRGGDTKLARIGPHTARMLDEAIHHGRVQRNPKTGLREYSGRGRGGLPLAGRGASAPVLTPAQIAANAVNQLVQNLGLSVIPPILPPMGGGQGGGQGPAAPPPGALPPAAPPPGALPPAAPPPGALPPAAQPPAVAPLPPLFTPNFEDRHIREHNNDRFPPGDPQRRPQHDIWMDESVQVLQDRKNALPGTPLHIVPNKKGKLKSTTAHFIPSERAAQYADFDPAAPNLPGKTYNQRGSIDQHNRATLHLQPGSMIHDIVEEPNGTIRGYQRASNRFGVDALNGQINHAPDYGPPSLEERYRRDPSGNVSRRYSNPPGSNTFTGWT